MERRGENTQRKCFPWREDKTAAYFCGLFMNSGVQGRFQEWFTIVVSGGLGLCLHVYVYRLPEIFCCRNVNKNAAFLVFSNRLPTLAFFVAGIGWAVLIFLAIFWSQIYSYKYTKCL